MYVMESHTTIYGLIDGIYYPKATESGLYEMLCSALDQFWPPDVFSWAPKTLYINFCISPLLECGSQKSKPQPLQLVLVMVWFHRLRQKASKNKKRYYETAITKRLETEARLVPRLMAAEFPVMYFVLSRSGQAQPWNFYNRTAKRKKWHHIELGSISIYLSNQVHLRGQHHERCQMRCTHNSL